MRTNLTSQFDPEQRKQWAPKIIARNTFRYTRNGETVIRLHKTDIVRKLADGSVVLNSDGWKTVTTKDRMNANMPAGYQITQIKGAWFVTDGNWSNPERLMVPYFDGMNVPRDVVKPKAKGARQLAREEKLRAAIRKFVCDVPKDAEGLPKPGGGDCWYCLMRTKEGETLGDATGSNDHILSHVKERYLHGSLIFNALKWAGYRSPEIFWHYGPTRSVRSALKRYLYRQCGLVA